jgi:hypothetical protein
MDADQQTANSDASSFIICLIAPVICCMHGQPSSPAARAPPSHHQQRSVGIAAAQSPARSIFYCLHISYNRMMQPLSHFMHLSTTNDGVRALSCACRIKGEMARLQAAVVAIALFGLLAVATAGATGFRQGRV